MIKVGYSGDEAAFTEIVRSCPTPIVLAGGPKPATFIEALQEATDGICAKAKGAWSAPSMWGAAGVTASATPTPTPTPTRPSPTTA